MREKLINLVDYIRGIVNPDEEQLCEFNNKIDGFIELFKNRWQSAFRMHDRFLKPYKLWQNKPLLFLSTILSAVDRNCLLMRAVLVPNIKKQKNCVMAKNSLL